MGNSFVVEPELSSPFPVEMSTWVCPHSGIVVPKTAETNLQWRVRILEMAEQDAGLQQDLYTACSKSLLFFVNAFCFTLRVFEAEAGSVSQSETKHVPFLTWPIQDKHLLRIEQAVDEGFELLTDKSRDMGATWDHMIVYVHRLLFRPSESHLLLSRKEDVIDQLGGIPRDYPFGPLADPGTLFGKIDYVLNRLPDWMLPKLSRKKLHLVNMDNQTRIDGESSNATAGSSDRRTSIFMDEFAKVDEAEAIKRSTRDVTACRLPCSTPNGAGTTYSKWRMSGTIETFVLPWWEHPEKGYGRYTAKDDTGKWKIRSPWYDHEESVRSPRELAIEIDMDHIGSGETFFEGAIIEHHRAMHARPPVREMNVRIDPDTPDADVPRLLRRRQDVACLEYDTRGPWKVWADLIDNRPDQTKTYVLSADISKGMGASNSVIALGCIETREKIAEWASATVPPYELARVMAAAYLWAGGRRPPLVIWENNGDPGYQFGQQLVHVYECPNIFFDRRAGTVDERVGKRYGWRSDPEKKAGALNMLRRAYARNSYVNPSEAALDEALTYVYYDTGGIGPASLIEESSNARATHGDRVIADMLLIVGFGGSKLEKIKDEPEAPAMSIGGRMKQWKRRKDEKRRGPKQTFDFRRA